MVLSLHLPCKAMMICASVQTSILFEKSVATNSRTKQQPAVSITGGNTLKKGHASKLSSNSEETILSSSFTASDKTTELKPHTLVRPSSERQQERSSSPRPDESSKMIKSRSVGAERNSPQIIISSQEVKDSTVPLISEFEVPHCILFHSSSHADFNFFYLTA